MPHVPAAVHPRPVLHVSPGQQTSPAAPQVAHVPARHARPVLHVSPAQQTSPAAPQLAHVPRLHASPLAVQTSPVQQV